MSSEGDENSVRARENPTEPPGTDTPPTALPTTPDNPLPTAPDNPADTLPTPPPTTSDNPADRDRQPPTPSPTGADNPLPTTPDNPDSPLSGRTWERWVQAYREVFGGKDGLLEERVRQAMALLERGEARSRVEALRKVASQGEPGGTAAPSRQAASPSGESERTDGEAERAEASRKKWYEAYRMVFGEEPDGELAEARLRAAMKLYDPERLFGRRQALEAVRASEEAAAAQEREAGRLFEEEPELEGSPYLPSPGEEGLTLGAALIRIGRLEAEVGALRRAVERLEERLHRTETRLGGLAPGLKAMRDGLREVREAALRLAARVDALAAPSPSGESSPSPSRKELRARLEEERGRILLEVEERLEEAEGMLRRALESRIGALESWVRRVSRYLGLGVKGGR